MYMISNVDLQKLLMDRRTYILGEELLKGMVRFKCEDIVFCSTTLIAKYIMCVR